MSICVQFDSSGYVQVMNPQPDLVSECQYLLVSQSDVSPFNLSVGDAGLLLGAIGVLWVLAFVFRCLARQILYT